LEKVRRETANQGEKCAGCGAPRPPFDEEQYKTLNYDDAVSYIVGYYCAPCRTCARESEMGSKLASFYGDGDANGLAE
jgi:hypothetical protein